MWPLSLNFFFFKSTVLTPWPWALVKAGPFLKSDLKNWWVKCWAKNANIRLVPCGSGINCLLTRSFSAKVLTSGSSFLPRETKNITITIQINNNNGSNWFNFEKSHSMNEIWWFTLGKRYNKGLLSLLNSRDPLNVEFKLDLIIKLEEFIVFLFTGECFVMFTRFYS